MPLLRRTQRAVVGDAAQLLDSVPHDVAPWSNDARLHYSDAPICAPRHESLRFGSPVDCGRRRGKRISSLLGAISTKALTGHTSWPNSSLLEVQSQAQVVAPADDRQREYCKERQLPVVG